MKLSQGKAEHFNIGHGKLQDLCAMTSQPTASTGCCCRRPFEAPQTARADLESFRNPLGAFITISAKWGESRFLLNPIGKTRLFFFQGTRIITENYFWLLWKVAGNKSKVSLTIIKCEAIPPTPPCPGAKCKAVCMWQAIFKFPSLETYGPAPCQGEKNDLLRSVCLFDLVEHCLCSWERSLLFWTWSWVVKLLYAVWKSQGWFRHLRVLTWAMLYVHKFSPGLSVLTKTLLS